MSIKVELTPDVEASLAAQAAARGMPLHQYLRRLLEGLAVPPPGEPLSPAERVVFWRNSVKGLPATRPLSDEAIRRESIYDARG